MPLKNLLNKTTAFIKHHSMVIISAALVMAAIGLGFMENRTINSAAYGIGIAGSVGSTPVSHHGTSDKDARPCIGVTPTTYDLTKILDEGTHSWNKKEEGDDPEAELDHLRDRRDKMKRLGKAYGKIEVNMDKIEGGIGNDSILNYIIMKYNRINTELKLLDNKSQISEKNIQGLAYEIYDYSAILLVFTKKLDPELTLNTKDLSVMMMAKANKKINDKNILEPFKNKKSRKEDLQDAIEYGNNVSGTYLTNALYQLFIGSIDTATGGEKTGDEPASKEEIETVYDMYSDLTDQLGSIRTAINEEEKTVRTYFGHYDTKDKKTSLHGKALMEIVKAKTGYSIRVPGKKESYELSGKDLYESTTAIIHTYNSVLKYIDRSYTRIQSDIKKLKKDINKNKSKARHALKGEMPTKDEVRSKSKKRDWKSQFDPQSNDKNKKLQYVWHQVTKTDGTNIYKTGNVYNWKLLANLNAYHPMQWTKGTLVYCPLSSVRGGRDYSHSVEAFYGSRGYDVRVETKDGEYREDTAHTMIVLDGLDKIRGTNTIIGDAMHRGDIGDEKSIFSPLINKEISNMKDEAKNEKNGWTETKVSQKFDGRDDNKHSLLNYEAFFQYLGSHDYKHLNELLKAAQGKRTKELESDDDKKKKDNDANLKRLQRAQKLFAEFTDVTESSGVKTSHVQLFNKYIAHTLYNNITNKDSRAYKELDRIKDYGQPNKNTISAQRGLDEIKPKSNDAEAKIQKNIRESLKGDGDDDSLIRNLGWTKDSHINSVSDAEKKRIAALDNMISPKYMTNEYCLAYLDLLLCGYSAAAANVKYPSKANTTRAWKEAIQDYIDSMTGDNNKYVVVRVDYGSWASSGSKMYFSSISSILNKKYNISQVTNMTTDPDKNAAAYSKGFIGMQYNGMEDNLLEFGWNGQITSYHKARNLGSYYYRVGRAIVENDKAAAKYADNWYSYNGIINRSIDFAKIESVEGWEDKFTSVSPWKTHWMEIIKGGMAFRGNSSKPIDYYKVDKTNAMHTEKRYSKQSKVPKTWHAYANGHYQYGSYITEPYSIYSLADTEIDNRQARFELRVYSAAAHGDSLSEPKPTKETNGKEIHNTGEYMKNAESISNDGSAGAYTVKETENGLKVKIDVPSDLKDNFNKILNNKKAYIRVQYYLDKEHGNDEAKSLECTDKFQETARDKDAVYKTVPGANDDGLLKTSEAWNSGDSGATKNKDGYYKVSDLKDKIEATSNYYNGTKNGWKKAKDYMNLVWNDSIKEMEKGFEVKLKPGEEKHYRICLRAKIKLVEIDSKGKITPLIKKNETWNEHGEMFTNPVYVTYKVKAGKVPPEVPYKFYANTGEADTKASADMAARAEFKEGSVYNETFEAMAGVPTTRTMYFATGGEEFIVNMQAVYDDYVATKNPDLKANGRGGDPDEYRAVRKYTVHFKGVDCEYKPGDTFKALSAGASSSEKFVSNKDDKKAEKQVTAEKNNAVNPTGASSYNTSTNSHGSDTTFRAQWTGAISNGTGYPTESPGSFNPGKPGSPDPGNGYDVGNGSQRMLVNAPTNWNTSGYNTALQNAINWAKQMETIGKQKDGTVFRIDDSDGIRRVYHIGDAEIKISLTGGGIGGIAVDGKSFNPGRVTGPTWTSGSASSAKIQSNDSATLGSGWYYNVGKDGVGSGYVAGCGHGCTKVWDTPPSKDSPGVPHTHTHQHGTFTPGVDMTHGKAATIDYVINVTFKNGTITADQYDGDGANGQVDWSSTKSHLTSIPAHAMCGSCCEHVLPAVEDTWTQKLRYDTIRFTGLKVWKLDDGYATDMSEVKQKTEGDGSGVEKDPKTFADLSQAPGNGDESTRPITGNEADYVRSKVVRYDPNIFYNIAMDNTSKAGRSDAIMVLDHGHIIEHGTYDELIAQMVLFYF